LVESSVTKFDPKTKKLPSVSAATTSKKHSRQEAPKSAVGKKASEDLPAIKKQKVKISDEDVQQKQAVIAGESDVSSTKSLAIIDPATPKQLPIILKENGGDITYHIQDRPNTSYIYCPEAQHFAPTTTTAAGSDTIAFLIPSSILNANGGRVDTSLLEVSCQVLNYYMWPMTNTTAH